jgi:porin
MTAYPNATWGGWLKVKPTPRIYIMSGIYNGDPLIRNIDNNGADFSMNGPAFVINEIGYQLNGLPGESRLLGNYKVGFWYDDSSFTDFRTVGSGMRSENTRGNWGSYGLFDQVLVPFGQAESNRGFGIFGSVLVAPDESISQLPYFFTAGVACRGLFDSRPRDTAGVGIVYGDFSSDLRHSEERQRVGVQNYETVVELTYRLYFQKSAVFFQPDLQYVIRPGGIGRIDNALVLGCQIGINF